MTLHFCTYENRPSHVIGVKLLALSLEKHCRNFHLTVFLPKSLLDFRNWAQKYCQHVRVRECEPNGNGWNVKPEILLLMLAEHREAIWIDSDIICVRNLHPFIQQLSPDTLLVAQDALPYPKEEQRTLFFGLTCVRKLDKSVNSCFIRVTSAHRPILDQWTGLMSGNLYQYNQSLPHHKRPDYMIGDQDVLEATLASGCMKDIPIAYLASGTEIITTIVPEAFSLADRIKASFGLSRPFLVHGQGIQPWEAVKWGPGLLGTARWQLSAYLTLAKHYRSFLGEDATEWMDVRTTFSHFCQLVVFHHPYLQGVPLLLVSSFWRHVLSFRRLLKRQAFFLKGS